MREMLNYYFSKDVLDKMDKKYYDQILSEMSKLFLYSNIIEMPLYYNIFKNKTNKDYNLYNLIHNEKFLENIILIADNILQNDYSPNQMLFLYCYISSYIFDKYLDQFIKGTNFLFKYRTINALEKTTYEEKTQKKIKKLKIYKDFDLEMPSDIEDILAKITYDNYLNAFGQKIFTQGLASYRKISKHYDNDRFGIKKIILLIKGIILFRNRVPKRYLSRFGTYKLDYLNKRQREFYLFDELVNYDFKMLYQKALEQAIELINTINQNIYFKKKLTIKNLEKFGHLA